MYVTVASVYVIYVLLWEFTCRGWRMSYILFCHSPLYSLERGSLTVPGASSLLQPGWLRELFRKCFFSPLPQMLGLQVMSSHTAYVVVKRIGGSCREPKFWSTIHIQWLLIVYNSSSRGSGALFWPLWALHSHAHTHNLKVLAGGTCTWEAGSKEI